MTRIFGDEAIEAIEAVMPALGDFMDAVDEAKDELLKHLAIASGEHPDGDDVQEDVLALIAGLITENNKNGVMYAAEVKRISAENRKRDMTQNPWDNGGKSAWKERKLEAAQ